MRYQILFHGSGFSSEMLDGKKITGFFTCRRIIADTLSEAEVAARSQLLKELKVEKLYADTTTAMGDCTGCRVQVEESFPISWWSWHFTRYARGFVFYNEEDPDAESEQDDLPTDF